MTRCVAGAVMMLGVVSLQCIVCAGGGPWYGALLPESVGTVSASAPVRVVDRSTIFDYMNGAGELYLAYDFQELAIRTYQGPERADIVAEVYRMASSQDAYGVWSHDRPASRPWARATAGIGQDRDYGSGLLRFWKGRFFVRILASKETEESRSAVLSLGRYISKRIAKSGVYPDLPDQLPKKKLIPQSVRYFHENTVLNYHYYLSDANLLNLSSKTDAVLAQYRFGSGKPRLLIVRYPASTQAGAAYARFCSVYFKDKPAQKGSLRIEKVEREEFAAVRLEGRMLRLVFDAASADQCRELLGA